MRGWYGTAKVCWISVIVRTIIGLPLLIPDRFRNPSVTCFLRPFLLPRFQLRRLCESFVLVGILGLYDLPRKLPNTREFGRGLLLDPTTASEECWTWTTTVDDNLEDFDLPFAF